MARQLLPCDGAMWLFEAFLPPPAADRAFATLFDELDWRREKMRIMGRSVAVPRLTAWYGAAAYRYSGIDHPPRPMPAVLHDLAARAAGTTGRSFDAVLANLYRDGADGMGWHADDEKALGENPVVAGLSLGATRRFQIKHKTRALRRIDLDLPSGSLLLMSGPMQHHWLHRLAKTKRPVGPRINLTFRRMARA